MKSVLSIPTGNKASLSADLFTPEKGKNFPVLVFCHGFKGFKDWGFFPHMHSYFTSAGIALLTFNFSGNGTTADNPTEFSDLDAFAGNTISLELQEIKSVIDWLEKYGEEYKLDHSRIYLGGHSRGGAEAIVFAAGDKRISKVVSWSPVSDFKSLFSSADKAKWKKEGRIFISNARTGQQMPLNYSLWEDIVNNKNLDVIKSAEMLEADLLLIHGEKDESVPVSHSKALYEACQHSILIAVENADHTFNARHPMEPGGKFTVALQEALYNTVAFLEG